MPLHQLPVFVYGTLRPGQNNYLQLLVGKTLREVSATFQGRLYYVTNGDYPYLEPGEGTVTGAVLTLAAPHYETTLMELDQLEEYNPQDLSGSVYLRRKAWVNLAEGKQTKAWTYFWNCLEIRGVWIASGDFLNRGK
jgi:gamma-glutamylcyclotransferase (GGCT)/AIG2-like uncharacterized protein YtfP